MIDSVTSALSLLASVFKCCFMKINIIYDNSQIVLVNDKYSKAIS